MRESYIKKERVRPTPALVRKAVFDILRDIEDKTFIDLYAGKGFVGIEALKRGAKEVVFVERDPVLAIFIKNSIQKMGSSFNFQVFNTDVIKFIEKTEETFDIVFADPPYESGELDRLFKAFESKNLIKNDGVLIIQHHKNESLREKLKDLKIQKCYRYGDTLLTLYRRSP